MKRLFLIFAVLLACWGMARTGSSAAAQAPAACEKPDSALLKSRGVYSGHADLPDGEKIERYNAQARRFNDCTRALVDGNNAEIDRVRDEGNANIQRIKDTANRQIDAIQEKVKLAISGAAGGIAGPSFPDPDCRKPDESLLGPVAGKKRATATAQYDGQKQAYDACVRDYITRASAETQQIADTANAEIRTLADEANNRIASLRSTVRGGIDTANAAAQAKSQAVEGTPLARDDAILRARNAENPQENPNDSKGWAVVQDTPTGEGNRRVITCRAPQPLPNSRLPGPPVCRRNGVWAALRKAGKDVGADGKTIVSFDETRRTNPTACTRVSVPVGSGDYGGTFANAFCN